MTQTQIKEWAREMIRDAILDMYANQNPYELDWDEENTLAKEVNRALKFFGFEPREKSSLFNQGRE